MAVTIKKIAELAGVAPTTVSLVLNGSSKIGEKTRQHVLQIVDELDYYPNQSGRLLKQGKSNAIGVMATFFQSFTKMDFVYGVEESIYETQYQLREFHARVGAQEEKIKEILYGKMADALILINTVPSTSLLNKLKKAEKYVILTSDVLPGYPGVSFDDEQAGREVIDYFVKKGRKKIAIAIGLKAYMGHSFVDDRLKGYIKGLREHDLSYSRILEMPEYSLEEGRNLYDQIFASEDEIPDAIFCASGDLSAAGLLQACKKHGIRVPDDLAVIGFDDSIIAKATTLGLSTVRQPMEEMGRAACEIAVGLLGDHPEEFKEKLVSFKPQIIEREST